MIGCGSASLWTRGAHTETAQSRNKRKPERLGSNMARVDPRFPTIAGILLGLGLGGFFDGIVLHQILQWHHMMTSAGYPADSVSNLEFNTMLDGLFHVATYAFTTAGLIILWRSARKPHVRWSAKLLVATMLMGFGLFNLVEGVVNHQILGLHHVNETVPHEQWLYWDIGFLLSGAAMFGGGRALFRAGKRDIHDALAR